MKRVWSFLRERYFTVDSRTLGLFRIVFGLHMIANLYDRTQGVDGLAFYTNSGVLPNHFALFAPMGERIWSLLFPFSTPAEVQVAFALILVVYLAYTVGYATKIAQLLLVACQVSLANRNLSLQNGGIVVTTVVAVWTALLPLGARFSVDELRRSLACRRESSPGALAERAAMHTVPPRYVRVAYFGILLNFACIYYFNCVHKRGTTWHDGSAVHWVLWQNRINTIWAAWIRMHEPSWLSPLATYGTLAMEGALPVLILSPIAQKYTRRAAILGIFMLHAGISLMMTLGPFSYTMMCFSLLLIGEQDWALVHRWAARVRRPCVVRYDARLPAYHRAARVLARLDVLGALTFVDASADDAAGATQHDQHDHLPPLSARAAGETAWSTGAAAVACVARALVLGRSVAWLLGRRPVSAWVERVLGRARRDTRAPDDPPPWCDAPAAHLLARLGAVAVQVLGAALLAIVVTQIGADNWAIPERYRVKERPRIVREIVDYLRIPQGWSMFSPEAPRDDGTLVIDALLTNGQHIDPRKQAPPDFEAALHGPWFDDQQWCDWDLRMSFDGNRYLYPGFRDYIAQLDRLPAWKQAATIRAFDVYWVTNASPPPGSTVPYNLKRKLLFSGVGRDP